jgi:biopolymer transport protein ExbD
MISRDGNLELSGATISLGRLPSALKETAAKGNTVTIRVDKYASAQLVNAVLDACKSCGVTHLFARISTAP